MTKCALQTDVLLSKPAALCMVSDDILLCADDGHRDIYQIQLQRDGVTIKGKSRKLVRYPEGAYRLESMTIMLQMFTSQRQKVANVTVACIVLAWKPARS